MGKVLYSYHFYFKYSHRRKKMPYESVFQSRGLSDEVTQQMFQLRCEIVPRLENLAMEALLAVVAANQFSANQISRLPISLLNRIQAKFAKRGIPCPEILQKLIANCGRELDLSNRINPPSIAYTHPANLLQIRNLQNLKRLCLDKNLNITDKMLSHLKGLTNLNDLSLRSCTKLTNALFSHVKELPNLRRLSVASVCRVTASGVSTLWTGSSSQLEYIDLSYTAVEDSHHTNIFKALLPHNNLTSLQLDGVKTLKDLFGLELLQKLKSLSVCHTALSSFSITQICQLSRLEELQMCGVTFPTDTDLSPLFSIHRLMNVNIGLVGWNNPVAIPPNAASYVFESVLLSTVCLANNKWITDHLFTSLSTNFTGLLELDISNTSVSSQCISQILHNIPQLRSLGLQGLPLSDDHMTFLSKMTELRKLNLSDSGLSDEFLTSGYLNSCQRLELLNLCRTVVTDTGLDCLKLSNLSTIWLDGCAVSVDVVLCLNLSCPKLSYVSVRNLMPAANDEDDEILPADVIMID